jgi:ubiquinone/menaquinone biosynthesis C-methylase UbiE
VDKHRLYEEQAMGDYAPDPMAKSCIADRKVLRALAVIQSVRCRLLDLGCGAGGPIRILKKYLPDLEITALDGSLNALRTAECGAPSADYVCADGCVIPFRASSFDTVTALDIFEQLEDFHGALREVHRVLRPGGLLITHIPCEANSLGGYWLLGKLRIWDYLTPKHAGHIQKLSPADVSEALALAGFRLLRSEFAMHFVGWIGDVTWYWTKELTWRMNRDSQRPLPAQRVRHSLCRIGRGARRRLYAGIVKLHGLVCGRILNPLSFRESQWLRHCRLFANAVDHGGREARGEHSRPGELGGAPCKT